MKSFLSQGFVVFEFEKISSDDPTSRTIIVTRLAFPLWLISFQILRTALFSSTRSEFYC